MIKLVLLRHGESLWNLENRFTGWTDIDLSSNGIAEAERCGQMLLDGGFSFDVAYVSVLKRAIRTLWITLDKMDSMWIPVNKSWRLNERHYGALQGLNKAETAAKYGEDQVHIWRRSFEVRPPALDLMDSRYPGHDPRYADLDTALIPLTESLSDTLTRFAPYWDNIILPVIREGKKLIIVAHGNTLRAVVKILEKLSDDQIVNLEIPTGLPLVYELSNQLVVLNKYYLGVAK